MNNNKHLEDAVKRAERDVKVAVTKLEKAQIKLQASSKNDRSIFLKSTGYKDVKMDNGLLISQMLRNPLYNDILTSGNLARQANYNQWKARNLAAYHRSGDEKTLGWE